MRETQHPVEFKAALLDFLEINDCQEIRETCEAIRQMYQAELIDILEEVLEDEEAEPFKAAGK